MVINEQTRIEDQEWEKKKKEKRDRKEAELRNKQLKDIKAFIARKESAYMEFKKKRAIDFNNLIQKFKNKRNDIIKEQNNFLMWQKNLGKTKSMMNVPGSTKNASKK